MPNHSDNTQTENFGNFPTDIRDLPDFQPSEVVVLADGEELDLRIAPMVKRLRDATVRMLDYNGSVPGPTMRVQQTQPPPRRPNPTCHPFVQQTRIDSRCRRARNPTRLHSFRTKPIEVSMLSGTRSAIPEIRSLAEPRFL